MMRFGPGRGAAASLMGALCVTLAACGGSGAGPALYVLGALPKPIDDAAPQAGLQTLEVKPVQMPAYLDTTDLVTRGAGGQLNPSGKGRWGERLSEGFTRALTSDLAQRLPQMVVTGAPPLERPARQVLVDIEAFEATTDGSVVLIARWAVTDSARQTLAAERTSVAVPVPDGGDPAVATAMTQALQSLAARIASATGTHSPERQAAAHKLAISSSRQARN
jgi:uncharacterized lipoprotein YmbA